MPNLRKKINRLAPFVISAAMLLSLSAAVYGFYGEDPEVDPSETTTRYWWEWESTTTTTRYWWEGEDTTTTTTTSTTTPGTTTPTPTVTTPGTTTTPPSTKPGTTTTPPSTNPGTTTTGSDGTDPTETTPDDTESEPPVDLPPAMSMSFTERWLTVGDGAQLNAQVINIGEDEYYPVSFYSSNTSVVRVDASGYIIAVGAGSAVVTAYSGDIEGYAVIYVSLPAVVPEYIVLSENRFTLKIDQTAQIQARLLPEEAADGYSISYTSNDPSIAVVDENGLITALSEGETTITVEGAGLKETVYVTVSSDIAYDTARLDGFLYGGNGKPIAGTHLMIDGLTAVTDKAGYFVFDSVEQRTLTVRLADDANAACQLTVSGDTRVYLLYDQGVLTRLGSYEELAGQLEINSVKFDAANIVLTEGEVYELNYSFEPSDATVTAISYSSSNTVAAVVGQVDGVITARSPGEATITISLNNGQALAECTVTVNPRESSEYSVLIIVIEAAVFAIGTAVVLLSYRSYNRRTLNDLDEDEDDDLHDIE